MEETGFPKYQWSKMIGRDRAEQFVFRSNDWDEFKTEVVKIKTHFELKEQDLPVYTQQTVVEDLGVCSKCGAPNKRSKQGKVYCSKLCWLSK